MCAEPTTTITIFKEKTQTNQVSKGITVLHPLNWTTVPVMLFCVHSGSYKRQQEAPSVTFVPVSTKPFPSFLPLKSNHSSSLSRRG